MQKFFLLCALMWVTLPMAAQYTVSGRVIDNTSRQPLDFVNVSITPNGATGPTAGTATDTDGRFILKNLPTGNYTLQLSFVGYADKKQTLHIDGKSIDLGKIILTEDSRQLSEVEVVGQGSTMRFELDKKVFSVDQSIAATGGSASEALQNVPSVDVDNEGNIALRNSESVEVWINGKPAGLTADNRAQVLQQMPAESIQEIEIITNPSAKYSPEGTAGIINLVLKKNRKSGYYGSVGAGITYPQGASMPGYNVDANINYNKGIVDTYLNMGYRRMSMAGSNMSDRYTYAATDTTRLYQEGDNDRNFGGLFLRAGIDLRLGDKSTLGLSGFGMLGDRSRTNNHIGYTLTNETANTMLRKYERIESSTGGRPGYSFTLNYKADFTKTQDLQLSASYSAFNHKQEAVYTQNNLLTGVAVYENGQQQTNNNNNGHWEMKADYTNNLTPSSKLEAGWQTNIDHRTSLASATDALTGADMPAFYNDFDYREQVHALYATYGNRFWNKLSVQVGLRGEYMQRKTNTNGIPNAPKTYWQLFPSAYLSYAFKNGHEMQLNYTRRIDRPRGRQINPFRDLSDSTNITYGNSDLLPQFTSSAELNYLKSWEKHTLSAGLFYHFTDSVIQNVRYLNGSVMESTFINMSKQQDAGIELVLKNRFWTWLQLTTSVNGYYSKMQAADYLFAGTGTAVHIDGQTTWAWGGRINANMLFTKTFSGQLSARYSSPTLVAQGTRSQSYAIDLGLRKSFFDRKLSLSLSVRDLLNSNNRRSEKWGDNFYQIIDNQWHGRTIGFTATYSFGNMKSKKQDPSNSNSSNSFYEDSEE